MWKFQSNSVDIALSKVLWKKRDYFCEEFPLGWMLLFVIVLVQYWPKKEKKGYFGDENQMQTSFSASSKSESVNTCGNIWQNEACGKRWLLV